MKKIGIFFSCIALLLTVSCKKNDHAKNVVNKEPDTVSKQLISKSQLDYFNKLSENDIKKKLGKPKSEVSAIRRLTNPPDAGTTTDGQTCCSTLIEANSYLADVKHGPDGCGGYVTAIYYWTVLESVCSTSPNVDYSFTVNSGSAQTISANLVDQYSAYIDWYCCYPSGVYSFKTYLVEVSMTGMEFSSNQSYNTVTGTNGCVTNSITNTCPLSFAYCGNPAIAYVNEYGVVDAVQVSSQCGTLCFPPPHVQCPNNGIFSYRLAGTTSWTTVAIHGGFNTISIPVDVLTNFEYKCVYNYGSPLNCSSSESSGTFVVYP